MRIYTAAILIWISFLFPKAYSQTTDTVPDPRPFSKVEKEAAFPGGEQKWRKFLEKNLNPNVPVKNGAPAGIYRVYIQFIVNKDGSIGDMKALTNMGFGMENEVMRILSKAGPWEPATVDGKPLRAYRKQPVIFSVVDESFDVSTYTIYSDRDNEFTITAGKVKSEDLEVTISRGTITAGDNGKFIVHVTGKDRVIMNIRNKKKNKKIGVVSFEVN